MPAGAGGGELLAAAIAAFVRGVECEGGGGSGWLLKAGSGLASAGAGSCAAFFRCAFPRAALVFGPAPDFLGVAEPFVSLAFLDSLCEGGEEFSDVRESVGGCGLAAAAWLEGDEPGSFLEIHIKNNAVTTTMSNPAAVAAPAAIQIRVLSVPRSGPSADLPRFPDAGAWWPALSRVLKISLAAAVWSVRGRVRSMIVPEPARDGGLACPGMGGGVWRAGADIAIVPPRSGCWDVGRAWPPLDPPTGLNPAVPPAALSWSAARPYSSVRAGRNGKLHRAAGRGTGGDLNGVADVDW